VQRPEVHGDGVRSLQAVGDQSGSYSVGAVMKRYKIVTCLWMNGTPRVEEWEAKLNEAAAEGWQVREVIVAEVRIWAFMERDA